MLVLTRRIGESIKIDDDITIKLLRTWGRTAWIGIGAPRHVQIVREELYGQWIPDLKFSEIEEENNG